MAPPRIQSRAYFVPLIIALNVVVYYLWQRWSPEYMANNFLVSWSALHEGRWWTLWGSVFSHNMFFHLFINMFVLANFGSLLERIMGSRAFIAFYLIAGAFSSFAHSAVSLYLLGDADLPALGASGAVSGLVMLFCFLFPKEKILIFGLIPIPAWIGAFAFVGLDAWGLVAQAQGGGLPIGHGAHLGGALIGVIWYFLFLRRRLRGYEILGS